MVTQLPIVEMKGKRYFRDDRLQQFRNVENPNDYVDFDDLLRE